MMQVEAHLRSIADQRAGGSGEDDDEKLYKNAMEEGFLARGRIGLRFNRSDDGGQSTEYKELTSNKAKADFRKAWAAAQYQKTILAKEKHCSWQKADERKGTFLPFEVIVDKEGGGSGAPGALEAALGAAEKYCTKAAKMGGGWTRYNELTERQEFLYVRYEVSEIFRECWSAYERQCEQRDGDVEREEETPKPKAKAKTRPKPLADATDLDPPGRKKEKSLTSVERATLAATTLKKNLTQFFSQFYSIKHATASDPEWKWAEQTVGDLCQIHKSIDEAMTAWGRSLLALTPKELRRAGDEEFIREVDAFTAIMHDHLERGLKEVRMLLRMQKGRSAA